MKVSLSVVLVDHSGLFQQIAEDMATDSISLRITGSNLLYLLCYREIDQLYFHSISPNLAVKLNVHILPKTTRVIIFHRLCISKSLKTQTNTDEE